MAKHSDRYFYVSESALKSVELANVLLICHEAWNLSVLQTMQLPDQWPNPDADATEPVIHRVDTDKPRRGGHAAAKAATIWSTSERAARRPNQEDAPTSAPTCGAYVT
ncbi:MAG: hypothetical protein ACRDQ5_03530, partial [Sciscionella sp.]